MSSGKGRRKRRQTRKAPASQAALSREGYGSPGEMRRDHETRSRLHPSLRDMAPDDEINVIMTTGDEVPPSAGPLLGTLEVPQTAADGTVIPAGAKVYRDLRPGDPARPGWQRITLDDLDRDTTAPGAEGERWKFRPADDEPQIPAAFRRAEIVRPGAGGHIVMGDPLGTGKDRVNPVAAMVSEDLARKETGILASRENYAGLLAAGLPQVGASPLGKSRTAVAAAGSGRHSEDAEAAFATMLSILLEQAEPGLAERLAEGLGPEELQRLAPVIADAARKADERLQLLEDSDDRSHALIAGGDPANLIRDGAAAEAVPVRTSWPADQVLDMHAWLARGYTNPDRDLGDYLARLIRTAQLQAEDLEKTAMMFYPVDLGLGAAGPEEGEALARVIGHGLREARTYQVTTPMVARMRDVFRQAGAGIRYLDGGELPSHAGFAWMDSPWLITEAAGYIIPFRAVSWEKTVIVTERDGRVLAMDAARIVMWTLIEDDTAFGRWDDPQRASRAASRIGRLMPQHVAVLPFSRQFSINEGFEEQGSDMLALIHILWAFLGMELSASRPVPPASPHTERRARRSLKHEPGVHVITLRRISYISDGVPSHREVNRTCRWWTEDFYRHIDRYDDEDGDGRRRRHEAVPAHRTGAHPADDDDRHDVCAVCLANDQTVRITLVHGHFRGPTWLPVKPRRTENDTLYRLAR